MSVGQVAEPKLFIGLMSGTSMDGIDAALVELPSNRLIHGLTYPYSKETRMLLNKVLNVNPSIQEYCQLNILIGRDFAKAALELRKQGGNLPIVAIGSHGQTIEHNMSASIPYTLQLGCAHTIAELTNLTVVADFRSRDLVVGGQGAPLAPLYHQALFSHLLHPLAIINIGGIANLSWIGKTEIEGYDLGPGNCLMDTWISHHQGKAYDHQGKWADSGQIIPSLLEELEKDAYFDLPFPKSIGKEYFSLTWLKRHLPSIFDPADVQATLLVLTAKVIAKALSDKSSLKQLILCGGGVHNQALIKKLEQLLPEMSIVSTAVFSINPDFIEAAMFAWLAEKTLRHSSVNLKKITGSKKNVILGAIYYASIDKGN